MDLTPLKYLNTFGLNKIYLMFDKINLNLSYHVCVNKLVTQQSNKEIESLQCPCFVTMKGYECIQHLDHIYFILTGGNNIMPFSFQDDFTKGVHEGHTVTYVAIQIAYYMGFSTIFLIGLDHYFQCNGAPNETQLHKGDDPNHFDPRYFKEQEWQLPDMEAMELAYRLTKYHFAKNGRQIYDATVDGKLEIFPKISYQEALSLYREKNSRKKIL
jgi:hypothetical protein